VLLKDRTARPWPLPQGAKATFKPDGYYLGAGTKTPLEAVDRLALTPPPDPQPLPLIDDSDIHLICWMAVVPA
jgi:hypothetical protein